MTDPILTWIGWRPVEQFKIVFYWVTDCFISVHIWLTSALTTSFGHQHCQSELVWFEKWQFFQVNDNIMLDASDLTPCWSSIGNNLDFYLIVDNGFGLDTIIPSTGHYKVMLSKVNSKARGENCIHWLKLTKLFLAINKMFGQMCNDVDANSEQDD